MATTEVTSTRPRAPQNVTIEDAKIFFKNFAGREGQYNQQGDRNFGCALPDDVAELMLKDGWNVKYLKPRDEGDVPLAWIPVAVSFKYRPPRVVGIVKRFNHRLGDFEQVRTTLPEELVEMLDIADMETVDLILNPYPYNFNGRSGIKAYLQSIYVTIRMDALEAKYAAVPEIDMVDGFLEIADSPFDDGVIDVEFVDDEDESV